MGRANWLSSLDATSLLGGPQGIRIIDFLEKLPAHVRVLFALGVVCVLAMTICLLTASSAPNEEKSVEELEGESKIQELQRQKVMLAQEVAELSEKIQVAQSPPLSDEELRRRAYMAAGRAEEALRQRVETVINVVAPVVVRVKRVQGVVKDAVETTKSKAAALATDKGTGVLDLVLRALEVDMSAAEALQYLKGTTGDCEDDDSAGESLPLSLLLAGLVAPIQLQMVAAWNRLQLVLAMILLLVMVGVMSFDVGRPCGMGTLWTWTIGLSLILSIAVCARLVLLSRAVAELKKIRRDGPQVTPGSGEDWILQMRQQLTESSEGFFDALVGYDELASSWPCSILNMLNAVQILWGGLGVYWTIKNVYIDETQCQAGAVMLVAHSYSFIYVMLLTWTVPLFALWIITNLLSIRTVSLEVLRRAKQFDEDYSIGVPVATLLTRIFLLQSVADIRGAECQALQTEVAALTQEKGDIQTKSAALEAEIQEKERQYKEMIEAQRKEAAATEWDPVETQDPAEVARELAMAALDRAREAGLDVDGLVQRAREAAARETVVDDPLL